MVSDDHNDDDDESKGDDEENHDDHNELSWNSDGFYSSFQLRKAAILFNLEK